jgi:serine/threonine-protein kinase
MSQESDTFEVFGDYVLLKSLAAGGMAEVFLARPASPNSNGRIVVIKRVLKEIANDPVFIKMFRSEIRVSLGFSHPHCIQLHDFGEIDYQPYIAMEYIEGKSLKQIMEKFAEKGERIPVPTVLGLIAQSASGLNYAHHFENTATGELLNAVHRDISPHNLLVSYDGNLKVIDFGIAKAKGGIADKTRAGQIKGKCAYLSPEQLNEENLDGRSDVFSLGIVMWELLTSQRLFHKHGDTELQIIQRIQNCEQHLVPPSTVNPEIPKEVDEVVMKALAKNRDERYATAAGFQAACSRVMRQLYPSYTYGDTAQLMLALFETERMIERMELRDANDRAQELLSADVDAKTRVVDPNKDASFFSNVFKGMKPKAKHLPSPMELRMGHIESMLSQKASGRHFAMVAFYVLSLAAIKLDERYSLLDRFFMPAEAESFAYTERMPKPRAHARHARMPASVNDAPVAADPQSAVRAPAQAPVQPVQMQQPAPVQQAAPQPVQQPATLQQPPQAAAPIQRPALPVAQAPVQTAQVAAPAPVPAAKPAPKLQTYPATTTTRPQVMTTKPIAVKPVTTASARKPTVSTQRAPASKSVRTTTPSKSTTRRR